MDLIEKQIRMSYFVKLVFWENKLTQFLSNSKQNKIYCSFIYQLIKIYLKNICITFIKFAFYMYKIFNIDGGLKSIHPKATYLSF